MQEVVSSRCLDTQVWIDLLSTTGIEGFVLKAFFKAKELPLVSSYLHWDLVSYSKSAPFKISWLSENASCVMWSKAGHKLHVDSCQSVEEGHGQRKLAAQSFGTITKFIRIIFPKLWAENA